MTRTAPIALLALAAMIVRPVQAHQLDEYVQATLLDCSADRVVVELSLTPGAAIAPEVFAMIDRDGDHLVVPADIADYARQVLDDLLLSIDDRRYPLTLTSAAASSWNEMREGTGTIRLEAVAAAPLGRGRHHVFYENRHAPAASLYLVNALKPSARGIVIESPRRDNLQHRIDIDVEVGTRWDRVMWTGFAVVGLALLWFARQRGATAPGRSPTVMPEPFVG